MLRPESILDILSKKTNDYCFSDLYKLLYNKDLYKLAYERQHTFIGVDSKKNIYKKFEKIDLDFLINSLQSEQYEPKNDVFGKLLQANMRLILSAIYNIRIKTVSETLWELKTTATATKWWIQYSIEKKLNKKNVLLFLQNKIKDVRFLNLIQKFLNMDDFIYTEKLTYSNTAIYSILNSCLFQIITTEIYTKLCNVCNENKTGKSRHLNKTYMKIDNLSKQALQRFKKTENKQYLIKYKQYNKDKQKITSVDEFDESYKRVKQYLYMSEGLISIIGSKEFAKQILEKLNIITNELFVNVNTKVYNAMENKLYYLSTQIIYNVCGKYGKDNKRQAKGNIVLSVPYNVIIKNMIENSLGYWQGKRFIVTHKTELINDCDLEIFLHFTNKLERLYNYYKICQNVSKLDNLANVYMTSLAMTLASKYKTSCPKIYNTYKINGNLFGLKYFNKAVEKCLIFKSSGYVYVSKCVTHPYVDLKNLFVNLSVLTTNLSDRMNATKCSICGSEENLRIHHVRSLKNVSYKEWKDKKISQRERKTIVVCEICHKKIHHG